MGHKRNSKYKTTPQPIRCRSNVMFGMVLESPRNKAPFTIYREYGDIIGKFSVVTRKVLIAENVPWDKTYEVIKELRDQGK